VRGQLTMTYATVQDMVDRFGETEMIRLSRPEDRDATTVLAAKVELAIADACGQIDDYLRGRPEKSIVRATCVLARYDLAKGERTDPTEPMRLDRKEVIAWLDGIAAGRINIDAPPAGELGSTGARISDRTNVFDHQRLRG
jgi:phage gp36-like protein